MGESLLPGHQLCPRVPGGTRAQSMWQGEKFQGPRLLPQPTPACEPSPIPDPRAACAPGPDPSSLAHSQALSLSSRAWLHSPGTASLPRPLAQHGGLTSLPSSSAGPWSLRTPRRCGFHWPWHRATSALASAPIPAPQATREAGQISISGTISVSFCFLF